jgi:hypothetical protein
VAQAFQPAGRIGVALFGEKVPATRLSIDGNAGDVHRVDVLFQSLHQSVFLLRLLVVASGGQLFAIGIEHLHIAHERLPFNAVERDREVAALVLDGRLHHPRRQPAVGL